MASAQAPPENQSVMSKIMGELKDIRVRDHRAAALWTTQ